MKNISHFDVPGKPMPKARPRLNRKTGAIYTPNSTKVYEDSVAWCATAADLQLKAGHLDTWIVILFVVSSKKPGDIDNLAKSVLDGIKKAYPEWDDAQVFSLHVDLVQSKEAKGHTYVWIGQAGTAPWFMELPYGEMQRISEYVDRPSDVPTITEGKEQSR